MKKIVSVLLMLCMAASAAVMLTSCDEEHVHSFKAEWAKDDTSHWHECEGEGCLEVADKAEHDFGEDGICSVCQAEKPASGTGSNIGISVEKWNEMIDPCNFENYTLTESQYVIYEDVGMQQDTIFMVAGDKVLAHMTIDGTQLEPIRYTGEEADQQKKSYESIFFAVLGDFENFTYDSAEKAYKTNKTITTSFEIELYQTTADIVMENAKVTLSADGRLWKFEAHYTQTTHTPSGTVVAVTDVNWVFSDYGTTVIPD